jgi:hypothetical protein
MHLLHNIAIPIRIILKHQRTRESLPHNVSHYVHMSPPAPNLTIAFQLGYVRVGVRWWDCFGVHAISVYAVRPGEMQPCQRRRQFHRVAFVGTVGQAESVYSAEPQRSVVDSTINGCSRPM